MTSPAARAQAWPPLAVHHYAARPGAGGEPLVLLHGWGCDSRTWQPLLPELCRLGEVMAVDLPGFGDSAPQDDYRGDALLAQILDILPPRAVLLGWSLGGMLAVALAARYPERVSRVITLAANLHFVARDGWSNALAPAVERRFTRGFVADPEPTHRRFTGLLAQGDGDERRLLRQLRRQPRAAINHNWLPALELLNQLDNRRAFAQLRQPGLHLYGERDALVPAAVAGDIARANGSQRVELLPGAAHALHWSQPQRVLAAITGFLAPRPEKHQVARAFGRAAASYNGVAHLQRAIGERLLTMCPRSDEGFSPKTLLDLGCGTGWFSGQLAERLPSAQVLGLDIAQGMVQFAYRHSGDAIGWLCGDAEALPLADSSVDLIYANLTIQWCNDEATLFRELHRVLRPGGHLLFSTLGPDTLRELRRAWQQVNSYTHVNRFAPAGHIQEALANTGLELLDWRGEQRVVRYRQLTGLTRELKALGAHNSNAGRPGGLTGRRSIRAFRQAYEAFRQADGQLPASYQVYYALVRRP